MPLDDANYIDGSYVNSQSDRRIQLLNPATESSIGTVVDSDPHDVDRAVTAAARAFPAWAALPPATRGAHLRAFADALERRGEAIAQQLTSENGTPITIARRANTSRVGDLYRYFASLAETQQVESTLPSADGSISVVRREPLGVAALIVPWNAPTGLLAWKLGPALAAGCTVVIKPAPETTLDLEYLVEAANEAGIPPGVINIIAGAQVAGEALVQHPLVTKVSFTGSTAVGKAIAAAASGNLKHLTLELGGKSAAILLDDADTVAFTRQLTNFVMPLSGQVCYSTTRILISRRRYDAVLDELVEGVRAIRVGDPTDSETVHGPLVNARQRARVEHYIQQGIQEGARLVTGGGRPAGLDTGYFVEPTVFADVDNAMTIAREEIFGPVLAVIPFDDDDDAIAIANDSRYGLAGAVFTSDPERGLSVARSVQTGTFGINRYAVAIDAPYGGYKDSGIGREVGPGSLDGYTQTKTIYI